MRRLYVAIALMLSVVFVSCKTIDSQVRDTRAFVTAIWHEANVDLCYVNHILFDAIHIDYMLSIEDESVRKEYFDRYYGESTDLYTQPNGLLVQRYTSIGTPIKTYYDTGNKPLGEGEWRVRYNGGNSYEMVLTPQGDGRIKVEFVSLYLNESSGDAELIFSYEVGEMSSRYNVEVEAEYSGWVEMVDPSMGDSTALTLKCSTTRNVKVSDQRGFLAGEFYVQCTDNYYDTYDEMFVALKSFPQYVLIDCFGESYRLDGRYGI